MGRGIKKVFVTKLADMDTAAKDSLGDIRHDGDKVYKYVKFLKGTGSITFAVGDIVFWSTYADNEVTADLTDIEANMAAGVAMGAVAAAADFPRFGWIQVKGRAVYNTALTAGAAGNALTAIGAGDKTLDVSALVTDPIVAVVINTTAKTLHADFPL